MLKSPHSLRKEHDITPLPGARERFEHIDPDLLYVECRQCGNPVLWGQGRTAKILKQAGIPSGQLSARHLLVTDGCPSCSPDQVHYETHVIELPEVFDPEMLALRNAAGTA